MREIWRDIAGFEDLYQVSNYGNVKGKKRRVEHKRYGLQSFKEKILKQQKDKGGYLSVILALGSCETKYKSVHRLVAEAFLINPYNKKTVNHINGIKTDNNVNNIEWATQSENLLHAFTNGLKVNKNGEEHYSSVLNKEQVIEIYKKRNILKRSSRSLAKEYNVSRGCIMGITKGRNWKQLQLENNS